MRVRIKDFRGNYVSTWDSSTLIANRSEAGLGEEFTIEVLDGNGPAVPEPPTQTGDMIDISNAIECGSNIGVAHWPATAKVTKLSLLPNSQGFNIEFTKSNTWPEVIPPGWESGIQYTLWLVKDKKYIAGCFEYWKGCYFEQGGNPTLYKPHANIDQIAQNWLYWNELNQMQLWQPQFGETVGFFVTSGDQRRMNLSVIQERSNVVSIPFVGANGGEFNF